MTRETITQNAAAEAKTPLTADELAEARRSLQRLAGWAWDYAPVDDHGIADVNLVHRALAEVERLQTAIDAIKTAHLAAWCQDCQSGAPCPTVDA